MSCSSPRTYALPNWFPCHGLSPFDGSPFTATVHLVHPAFQSPSLVRFRALPARIRFEAGEDPKGGTPAGISAPPAACGR